MSDYIKDILNESILENDSAYSVEVLLSAPCISVLEPRILIVFCESGRHHLLPTRVRKVDAEYIKSAMLYDIDKWAVDVSSCCFNVVNSNKFYELKGNVDAKLSWDVVMNTRLIGEFPESAEVNYHLFLKNKSELVVFDPHLGLIPTKFFVPEDFDIHEINFISQSTERHVNFVMNDGTFVSVGATESSFVKIPEIEIIHRSANYLLRMNRDNRISYVEFEPQAGTCVPAISERYVYTLDKNVHWVDDVLIFKLNEHDTEYYRIRLLNKITNVKFKDFQNTVIIEFEDGSVYTCSLHSLSSGIFLPSQL